MRYNEAGLTANKSSVFRKCRNFSGPSCYSFQKSLSCCYTCTFAQGCAWPGEVWWLHNFSLPGHWVTSKKSACVGKWGVGWTLCETSGCNVDQWGKHCYWSIQEQWEYKILIVSWSCGPPHWTRRKKGKVWDKIFYCVCFVVCFRLLLY